MGEWYCRKSVIKMLGDQCWQVVWEKGSLVRLTSLQSCRTSESSRSEWKMILRN
jgi:hypothetical protein